MHFKRDRKSEPLSVFVVELGEILDAKVLKSELGKGSTHKDSLRRLQTRIGSR